MTFGDRRAEEIGGGWVEAAHEELPTQDAQHLDVDHLRRRLAGVLDELRLIAGALAVPRSTSKRQDASTTSIGPRTSLLVECAQDVKRRNGA